jgi:hypothetical protein
MTEAKPRAPLPVVLVLLSFLCPTELSLYVAGLRLPPHRVALLVLFPIVVWRVLSQPGIRVRLFDVLFVAFGAMTIGVFVYHAGGHEGFVYGGSLALESVGAYFVARAYVRDRPALVATLQALFWTIVAAAVIALPETLFGRIFTHEFLASVTGYVHPIGVETRAGLTRAYGTFDHPIHYGTFCAAMLALFVYAERANSGARKTTLVLLLATSLGLSSAPLLCLGLQIAMIVWETTTRQVPTRVTLTLTTLTGLYIGASMFSNRSPIAFVATGMTFDPWTGFYRLQIWEHGMNNVWANMWTGIGLAEWERPWWMVSSTVDAFWLVVTMRQGIPSFLVLVLAIVLLARAAVRRSGRNQDLRVRKLMLGWMMSLVALCLIGVTVHYWNVLYAYFFFFLGLGGALADPERRAFPAIVRSRRAAMPQRRRTDQGMPLPEAGFVHPGLPYGRVSATPR